MLNMAELLGEILLIVFIASIILVINEYVTIHLNRRWWDKWNKNKRNFPIEYKGKVIWYSRSVAAALFVFAKDEHDNLYVLANKRGEGTPDFQGYWNVCVGYLSFNESAEQASIRECMEETGINVPIDKLRLVGVESSPSANKQNVTIRYMALMDETLNKDSSLMKFDLSNNEEDEVSDVRWINVDDIELYDWAFNHNERIKEIVEEYF